MKKIRLAIADDHALFRKSLIHFLGQESGFEILFEAGDGSDLLDRLELTQPDIILMDINMPRMNGFEATELIRKKHPAIRIIAISMHEEESYILRMLELGAKAYILKSMPPGEVTRAIFSVSRNNYYFNDVVSATLLQRLINREGMVREKGAAMLSGREMQVLRLIRQQFTTFEIAEQLRLSSRTVESYRKSLITKTGARNIVGVIVYAFKEGILS